MEFKVYTIKYGYSNARTKAMYATLLSKKEMDSLIDAKNISEIQGAENMISGLLKSLFAVSENYPNLKANENFLQLQQELSTIPNFL